MKVLFIVLGTLSLSLGVLGIVLPVLPTTPFLLLSATLYMHSSPKLYDWLINQRHFGPYIRNYREYKLIPKRIKVISMITLWSTMLTSIFIIGLESFWLQLLLLVIALAISYHILSHRSTFNE
ncbi:MAG: YbaN family protein [Rikenellaceae bacterium]